MTHESTLPETKGPHGWSREKGYYPLETVGDAPPADEAQVAVPVTIGMIASGATPAQLAELSDRYGANNVTENPDGSVTVSKTFSAAAVQEMFTHEEDEPPAKQVPESLAGQESDPDPDNDPRLTDAPPADASTPETPGDPSSGDQTAPGDPAAENQANQQ